MNYSQNIHDLDAAIQDLRDCELIQTTIDDLSEAVDVLKVNEIRDILIERNIPIPEGVSIFLNKRS